MLSHLETEFQGINYLGEMRSTCATLFLMVRENLSAAGLERVQAICELTQTEIFTCGGMIKEFSMDDKGCVLMAGFGLPPAVLANASVNAVVAVLRIKEALEAAGFRGASCGVATGPVLCDDVGSELRREFAMSGVPVILAARLMSLAAKETPNNEHTLIPVDPFCSVYLVC